MLLARAKAYAAGCERRFGWLLPFMTTQDSARDMDSIRAALGQQKISYLGYSYGTYLGQVYATMFGNRVRRMVLDSTVDPRGAWYARQHLPGLRVRGPDPGVLLLGRHPCRLLPARHHPRAGPAGLVPGPRPVGRPPDLRPQRPDDRARRVRRHHAAGRVQQFGLARPGRRPRRLPAHGVGPADDQRVQRARRAERERVRRLQRGRVQRRQLAAELGQMGRRHPAGLPDRAVRGLGQRVVQRGLRVLAGARPGPAAGHQGRGPAADPDDPGLA